MTKDDFSIAVNFLRNGGNALELQHLLGHSSLEVDLEAAHKRASPVANWKL